MKQGKRQAATPTPVPTVVAAFDPDNFWDYWYSTDQLELAKNEIYARHGRRFVTEYISDYFNSKSWYQGTVDPEIFDAQQDSVFNEYEMANIAKIAEWEERKYGEEN